MSAFSKRNLKSLIAYLGPIWELLQMAFFYGWKHTVLRSPDLNLHIFCPELSVKREILIILWGYICNRSSRPIKVHLLFTLHLDLESSQKHRNQYSRLGKGSGCLSSVGFNLRLTPWYLCTSGVSGYKMCTLPNKYSRCTGQVCTWSKVSMWYLDKWGDMAGAFSTSVVTPLHWVWAWQMTWHLRWVRVKPEHSMLKGLVSTGAWRLSLCQS